MAAIYLKHPNHGTKVAICSMEAEADAKNGWVVYNLDTPPTPIVAEAVKPEYKDVEIDVLRELWAERFGKAPHHKKTAETLRKELENGDNGG